MLEIDANAIAAEAIHEVHLRENIMIEARDGVLLANDIYRPAQNGQILPGTFPVLLQRTPYNKSEIELASGEARWFAQRGYIVVIQDCRGCFESGRAIRHPPIAVSAHHTHPPGDRGRTARSDGRHRSVKGRSQRQAPRVDRQVPRR